MAATKKAASRKTTKTAAKKSAAKKPAKETTGGDKRRARGEESVLRIVNAAIDLIAAEGLGSATMQRIAGEVGATSALVAFHFGNMDNLYRAVLEHINKLYDDLWQKLVQAPGLTAAQRLLGALDCAQTFMQRHPKGVSVLLAFSSDRKSIRLYRKFALPSDRDYLAIGRAQVREIAREGNYQGVDLDIVSESINYLIYGAWLWDHVDPRASRAAAMKTCAMVILQNAFPKHFER